MGSSGRRVRPITTSELDGWTAAPGRSQPRTALRSAAVCAESRWGFCGILAGTLEEPIGLLVVGPEPAQDSSRPAGTALLSGMSVEPGHRRQGIGRHLVQAAAAELLKHDVGSFEALAHVETLPDDFLTAVGFRPVSPATMTPGERRYRMELNSTVRWRPDLAAAWQRISGLVPAGLPTPLPPPQPAGFEPSRRVRPQQH